MAVSCVTKIEHKAFQLVSGGTKSSYILHVSEVYAVTVHVTNGI